jgi:hypothetical protein
MSWCATSTRTASPNEDGHLDLAVAVANSATVTIMLGDGHVEVAVSVERRRAAPTTRAG